MTLASANDVQTAYIEYFGRAADPVGLAYWQTQTVATMDAGFAASAEYAALYSGMSTSQIVTQVYLNVLGRAPDMPGLLYWAGQLTAGNVTVSNLVTTMVQNALGVDVTTIQNRITFATQYTAALDTVPEVNAYYGTAAANAARAAMLPVLDTPASLTAAEAALSTSVATMVSAGQAAAATTFTLTTGVDTHTASTFNALLTGTTTSTLNSFDTLTGTTGSTTNVLNINSDGTPVPLGVNLSNIQTVNINTVADQSVSASAWSGVTALNVTTVAGAAAAAAAVTVTAPSTAAVTDSGTVLGNTFGLTVSGGAATTVSTSGTDGGTAAYVIGNVSVTGSGAVSVTTAETITAASATGNVTAKNGTSQVVNVTDNVGVARAATTGTPTAGKAATITSTGSTGAVTINSTTNVTDKAAASDVIVGNAVSVTGGTTVTVNNTATAAASALAVAGIASVTDGAVTVLDGGTATSVTVTNAQATGAAYTAAVTATATTTTAGGAGYSALVTAGATAAAAIPGTMAVTAGQVIVAGASAGFLLANASSTITSATVNGYATGSYVNSSALTSLTLSGTGAGFEVYNVGAVPFTSLALNLNALTDATGFTIGNNHVSTLNVTTGGAAGSTLASITDTALTTLNVSGTQTLKLTTVPTSLTSIVVSGAAGFNDNGTFSGTTAGATLTTTSSGKITATLHAAGTDTFTGSTGQDIITITADQTKAVKGGSAANNELVLANTAALTVISGAAHTAGNVSGFSTLGINSAVVDGTYNAALLTGNTFNAIDVISGTGTTATVTNIPQNSSLSLDATDATAHAFVYQSADANGTSDVVTLNIGTVANGSITWGAAIGADTGATGALSSLVMNDANNVGIGTLNVVSNDTAAGAGGVNTITSLADSGLSHLNVSGVDGLTIIALNEAATLGSSATAATSFTLNNTSGGTATITTFTDSALGSLTLAGTGNNVISTLTGMTGGVLSITNSGTGTATITTMAADANLSSLTLTGQIALGLDNPGVALPAAAAATGVTTGVTVSAGTDNQHININLSGAALTGAVDTITLGNGNNFVTDGALAGAVNVTVGTGANMIDLHASTGVNPDSIILGVHTATSGSDYIKAGTSQASAVTANDVITGAVTGDTIYFNAASTTIHAATTAQQTAISALSSLGAAIGYAELTANGAAATNTYEFQYGGNTYLLNTLLANNGAMTTSDSIVELVGLHTIAAGAAHIVTVAS